MSFISDIKELLERFFPPKRIRLAVVGAPSSGKSFLLKDIIDALGCLEYGTYDSRRLTREDKFSYVNFIDYSPNQQGGNAGTPVYACRHKDHYGQRCIGDKKFDLDFLNIPGEIFTEERLKCYNTLKKALDKDNEFFVLNTYINQIGDTRLIVEPCNGFSSITDEDRQNTELKNKTIDVFSSWKEIFAELNVGTYQRKSTRKLSGKELLENFFSYDTDSVMQSIVDLIEKRQITAFINSESNDKSALTKDDFIEGKHIHAFVFFQYCTLATDIVICDRVFAHKEETREEISFDKLSKQLKQFLDNEIHASNLNIYLAFRNIDFLLQKTEVESHYQELLAKLKAEGHGSVAWRNALYSLFTYALLCHVGLLEDNVAERHKLLGLDKTLVNGLPTEVEELLKQYLSIEESKMHVYKSDDVKQHITSRIGGDGRAFRGLLQQTGWKAREETCVTVPHVHFTCTPITEKFEVFKNGDTSNGQSPFDFYRDGVKMSFSEQNSNAYFGSLQLCIDILKQHQIGDDISTGDLLADIFDLYD